MIRYASLIAAALIALPAGPVVAQSAAKARAEAVTRGKAIAEQSCARCHAVGTKGRSPMPDATAFRRIAKKYPIADLEEAFGEGDTANHKGMPDYNFTPAQVADLLDYMRSVQPKRR